MTKLSFIFLSVLYILISILSFGDTISIDLQILVCGLLITLVGIPHGAIDHILFLKESEIKPIYFFTVYLSSMLIYLGIWIWNPAFAFLIFLLISAYHFGESQLAEYKFKFSWLRITTFALWGINILSALLVYNHTELVTVLSSYQDLQVILELFNLSVNKSILLLSLLLLLMKGLWSLYSSIIQFEDFLKEIVSLALIHIAFFLLPLLIGFTLYFIILHSLKVMIDEYAYFKKRLQTISIKTFCYKLLPLTAISLVGSSLLVIIINMGILNVSYVLLAIVLISLITLPHSVVMHRFYKSV